jgi:hypothetical protein
MNMRAHKKQLIEWILLVVFWLSVIPGWSQEKTPFAEENTYITVSGVVKDKQNRKTLEYVNVSVPGRSVGTVTNADGEFSLKIEDAEMVFALEISHIGYHNNRVRLDKEHLSDLKIYLTPHANMLNEIVVYAHNPRLIVEEAIRKIPVNYSNKNNMLTGFYRETVQKGRRYINISEAIIDVTTPFLNSFPVKAGKHIVFIAVIDRNLANGLFHYKTRIVGINHNLIQHIGMRGKVNL